MHNIVLFIPHAVRVSLFLKIDETEKFYVIYFSLHFQSGKKTKHINGNT